MDPVSQGVLGAALSQSCAKEKKSTRMAFVLGWLSGMAADLDVLIRSQKDPLLFLEYHRHFTHSLAFVPLGSFLCALFFHFFLKKKISFLENYFYCFLGYLTHGLLDACTSYGTQLFWPFSNARISWDNVSIIDPLFTLPLLVWMGIAFKKQSRLWARISLFFAIFYLVFGFYQNHRALDYFKSLYPHSDEIVRIEAKPSFGNLLVWKIITTTPTHFYVDAVRVGFDKNFFPGDKIKILDVAQDLPFLKKESLQEKDLKRFIWFSGGYVALDPQNPLRVIDVRYSVVPNEIRPLWWIEFIPELPDHHIKYMMSPENRENSRGKLFDMLKNKISEKNL